MILSAMCYLYFIYLIDCYVAGMNRISLGLL